MNLGSLIRHARKEKKLTLPLIYALEKTTPAQRKHIRKIIKKDSENPRVVKEVIEFVRQSGGLEYTQKAMLDFRTQAFEILHTFPESIARQSLEDLVVFVTDRKK